MLFSFALSKNICVQFLGTVLYKVNKKDGVQFFGKLKHRIRRQHQNQQRAGENVCEYVDIISINLLIGVKYKNKNTMKSSVLA